ncbi:type VI secretion system baseplate subunit TssG [Parasulfuritortus cantonensis]|uniref:Type VI secretion system baseplate subunit TssG n=1 Tax=Parasulfuritortus cantonensis TaxID=2528202 RepID=A0A4R1BRP0_9PROT|nr:type VI secretion system baseplate subunit TssG [Parasulfuritortus cantonensis]TCJ20400.1 type VI secretion system baseplate subunit TssG [Parasulfuritortus cantonensis]
MAGETRTASGAVDLLGHLAENPYAFGFFQAMRRIELADPAKPRIGTSKRLKDDLVRFAQEPSLAFAPSTLRALEPAHDGHPARLLVSFLGLLGPNGPLPLHLTEFARDRQRNQGDPTLVRFLDVFHHRLLSLFYRAWARSQPTVSLDRPADDAFGHYLGAFGGLGMESLRGRDSVPDYAKIAFTGLFARQVRNAGSLEVMLASYFRVPVRIEQCRGHWLELPRETRTSLSRGDPNARLGVTAVAGERVWDVQSKFLIVLGPLTLADYQRFLPGQTSLRRLADWIRNYVGYEFDWDLNLVLKKDEVPRLQLGVGGGLGWLAWLGERRAGRDADDMWLCGGLSVDRT